MVNFREKATGMIYHISNEGHINHFRANPRYEELKEAKKSSKKISVKKDKKTEVKVEVEENTEE